MKRRNNGVNYNYPVPYEGRMAKTYLAQMESDARGLRSVLNDDDDMPGWVKLYIATAADRMNTAARYMQYEVAQGPRSRTNPSKAYKAAYKEAVASGASREVAHAYAKMVAAKR